MIADGLTERKKPTGVGRGAGLPRAGPGQQARQTGIAAAQAHEHRQRRIGQGHQGDLMLPRQAPDYSASVSSSSVLT